MIDITFDLALATAKTVAPATIKTGAEAPVRVTFSTAPGTVSAVSLALGSDATPPQLLAYTDAWTQESATVWTATLDATDARLVSYLTGKGATAVNAELALTLDGVAQVAPNFQVTVQPKIVTGPATSEGGPLYYSEAQVDALLAAKAPAATTLSGYGITNGQVQVIYVADGDSRTDGTGTPKVSWFDLLCQGRPWIEAHNYGVGGKTAAQIAAGYAAVGAKSTTVSGGHQYSPAVTGKRGVYFIWAGLNDTSLGATAAVIFAHLQTLYAAARADGYFPVVGFKEPPVVIGEFHTAEDDAQRVALNGLLSGMTLGQSNTPDLLIDPGLLMPNPNALSDGTHPTAGQYQLIAQYVRETLEGARHAYMPFVSLRWTGAQAFSADGTVMTGFTVTQDNQGLYQPTTHQILCPTAGWVEVSAGCQRINIGAIGDVWSLDVWCTPAGGSASFQRTLTRQFDTSVAYGQGVNAAGRVQVAAGDLLDFRVGVGSGVNGWGISSNDGLSEFTLRYVSVQ